MAKKYTYSRAIETPEGVESFSAVEFDSFDEAIKAVDRGVSDRKLQFLDQPAVDRFVDLAVDDVNRFHKTLEEGPPVNNEKKDDDEEEKKEEGEEIKQI